MKIIIGVYFVIQILILSSLMVLQIQLPLQAVTMSLSCIAYLCVAFKKPGYYKSQQKSPSLSDQLHQHKMKDSSIIKQIDEQDEECEKSLNNVEKDNQKIPQQNQNQLNLNNLQKAGKEKEQSQSAKSKKISIPNYQKQTKLKAKTFKNQHCQKKINQQIRYCRVCKVIQPDRVRHCYECEQCICTFDHHCPWMSNCIGQKNRNIFWIYLVIQFIQFLLVLIQILKKSEQSQDSSTICFFAGAIGLVTLVSFVLLAFHTYLIMKNLTTWQLVRWDRISYLSIYKYSKSSPFSYGLFRNISDYFCTAMRPQSNNWVVNPEFILKNKQYQSALQSKQKKQKPKLKIKVQIETRAQTQRAISSPNYHQAQFLSN